MIPLKPICPSQNQPSNMTRGKVNLAYVTNHSARKAIFNQREAGIMKAADELSTLCGIDMCAIIFNPCDPEPYVWPSQMGAQRVIERFKNLSDKEQNIRTVNQETFTRQMLTKVGELVEKQKKKNREKEMTHIMYDCLNGEAFQNLSLVDLNFLSCLLSQKIRDIERRIELPE